MATSNIEKFWGSLVTEEGLAPYLEVLSRIEDDEEKTFALLSRVFFLLVMGVKRERDDAYNRYEDLLQKFHVIAATSSSPHCKNCSEMKRAIHSLPQTPNKLSLPKYRQSKDSSTGITRINSSPLSPICKSPKTGILTGCSLNVISKRKDERSTYPKQAEYALASPNRSDKKSFKVLAPETQENSAVKKKPGLIIPETLATTQDPYGNTDFFDSLDRTPPKCISRRDDAKEILEKSDVCGLNQAMDSSLDNNPSSPVVGKKQAVLFKGSVRQSLNKRFAVLTTPKAIVKPSHTSDDTGKMMVQINENSLSGASDVIGERSPLPQSLNFASPSSPSLLGYGTPLRNEKEPASSGTATENNVNLNKKILRNELYEAVASPCSSENSELDVIIVRAEDGKHNSCLDSVKNTTKAVTSTTSNSPTNIMVEDFDADIKENSRTTYVAARVKNKSPKNSPGLGSSLPTADKTSTSLMPSSKTLSKLKSEVMSGRNQTSTKFLRSYTSVVNSSDVTFKPYTPRKGKKTYKQTKLTRESFQRGINVAQIAGGLMNSSALKSTCGGGWNPSEDMQLEKVLRESLRTKEVEDCLRNKKSQLLKECPGNEHRRQAVERTINDEHNDATCSKSSRHKLSLGKTVGYPSCSVAANPDNSVPEDHGHKQLLNEEEVLASLDVDSQEMGTPGECPTSKSHQDKECDRVKQQERNKSVVPVTLGNENCDSTSSHKDKKFDGAKVQKDRQRSNTEVQKDLKKGVSPIVPKDQNNIPGCTSDVKCHHANIPKHQALYDSFDIPPPKEKDLGYAYKGPVVRKKSERKLLDGWECHECRDYYNAKGLSDDEKKRVLNKCSRHRSKYNEVSNTPQGFWNPDWDTINESADNQTQFDNDNSLLNDCQVEISSVAQHSTAVKVRDSFGEKVRESGAQPTSSEAKYILRKTHIKKNVEELWDRKTDKDAGNEKIMKRKMNDMNEKTDRGGFSTKNNPASTDAIGKQSKKARLMKDTREKQDDADFRKDAKQPEATSKKEKALNSGTRHLEEGGGWIKTKSARL